MKETRQVNIAYARQQARRAWNKTQREQTKLIEDTVPWWLIIIALVFYLISAPHTAATFDKLTPGWGWTAPIGVELGLFYTAFRRKQHERSKVAETGRRFGIFQTRHALELLLALTAIIVNGVGSLIAVVSTTNLGDRSLLTLADTFGALPATAQVALALVPLAALIIPIGTIVAGQGIAELVLSRTNDARQATEAEWQKVKDRYEYDAFKDAALEAGYTPAQAAKFAADLTRPARPTLNLRQPDSPAVTGETGQDTTGQGKTQREVAIQYLRDNHAARVLSLRELEGQTGIGKGVWEFAKKNYNGNGHHEVEQ